MISEQLKRDINIIYLSYIFKKANFIVRRSMSLTLILPKAFDQHIIGVSYLPGMQCYQRTIYATGSSAFASSRMQEIIGYRIVHGI